MAGTGAVTLQQLRHFVALADNGQVSRAAERCGISQPSMTASLQNLEAAVNARLLLRRRDGLSLSVAGERFLRHAQSVLHTLSEAVDDVRSTDGHVEGCVTIGVTDTITGYLLPALVATVQKQFPAIQLTIVERERSEIERDLLAAAFDFVILLVSNVTRADHLACETLLASPRRLWTSIDHPLAAQDSVSLVDVAKHNYILLDMDEHVETVRRYWEHFAMEPKTVFRSKSIEGVRSLVAQGMGVTILSDLVFRGWSHDSGRIRRKLLSDPVPSMDVGLAMRPGDTLSPAAEAVTAYLRTSIRNLANPG